MDKFRCTTVGLFLVFLLFTAGCTTTGAGGTLPSGSAGIPGICGLAAGDVVTDMQINNSSPIDLNEGEIQAISVTLTLNRPATGSGVVCMELKDSEIVRGNPMAIGIVLVSAGDQSPTASGAFNVQCLNNEIRGQNNALVAAFAGGTVTLQGSTGERRTAVRAQELLGIQNFAGLQVGISGERSPRVRVRCN